MVTIIKRQLPLICASLFFAGILLALYKLTEIKNEERTSVALYDQLSNCVNTESVTVASKEAIMPIEDTPEASHIEDESTVVQPTIITLDDYAFPAVDFDSLLEINSELIGWIIIEDTPISYPVVQGEDNQYYLRHLFDGTYSNYGCIFVDSRNGYPFTDKNTIIYGHHMKNELMFSSLALYKQQDYFDQHPEAMIITPTGNYLVHFFSGFVANTNDVAWETSFGSDDLFERWISDISERSLFESPVVPSVSDCIVTLSTCSYEFSNARFVLFGVLEEFPQGIYSEK